MIASESNIEPSSGSLSWPYIIVWDAVSPLYQVIVWPTSILTGSGKYDSLPLIPEIITGIDSFGCDSSLQVYSVGF